MQKRQAYDLPFPSAVPYTRRESRCCEAHRNGLRGRSVCGYRGGLSARQDDSILKALATVGT